MNSSETLQAPGRFGWTNRQWWIGAALFFSYLAGVYGAYLLAPQNYLVLPGSAIAITALFFAGIELWPIVFAATLVATTAAGNPLLTILIMPAAQTLQAVLGAYLIRRTEIDPLFRRFKDIFFLIVIVMIVGAIVPTFEVLTRILDATLTHTIATIPSWSYHYTTSIFALIILTPFLLRWFAKPRFSRTWIGALETGAVFLLLIVTDYLLFIVGVTNVGSIPLVYFLLVPLFWIALRLRPRFVTLSLVVTSAFALAALITGPTVPLNVYNEQLFQLEIFMIILAVMFYVVVSLEEDRRLHSNLMRSQLATLENAVARISSESQTKNDFIAVLAHELRNPLAPIMSSIELLQLKPNREKEEVDMLAMMEDRMQTVRRLLDDLLDISQISEGKFTLRKETIDVESVARRAVLSSSHHFKNRHQSFIFNGPKSPLLVEGDAVRLEQVISNLLTNASKYSDSGDQISLTITRKDDQAIISVLDNGIGIDPELLEHVFTPFHQLDLGDRSRKGLGIGLALVRSFVEMHDGHVSAASKGRGHGSQFTVIIPLSLKGAVEADTPQDDFSIADMEMKGKGPRILVIDDNDAAAWGIGKLLELQGCRVSYAYDGEQAIAQVGAKKFDIMLLDLGLPDQDGYSVAKTVRARGYRGRIIALTGYGSDYARKNVEGVGIESYLVKPAGLADLKRAIPELSQNHTA